MYNKNDKIKLDIIDMTYDGLGVAKDNNTVFFVKSGIIGDKVDCIITKNNKDRLIYAKALDTIKESPYKIIPPCKEASRCGGCMIISISYKKQLDLKVDYVKNCLKRIGKIDESVIDKYFEGIISFDNIDEKMCPTRYRNKLQIPFSKKDGKIIYGFYAYNTHYIIENNDCIVGFDKAFDILEVIKDILIKENVSIYDEETHNGYFREVILRKTNNTDEISVTFVVSKESIIGERNKLNIIVKELADKFSNIKTITVNINIKNNNVILGDKNKVLYGNGYIEDKICDTRFHISPESFYQVNSIMTEKLYNELIRIAKFSKDDSVLDMYCGIGTISLIVSKYVNKVLGVEIVEKAIENAKENAKINNVNNVEFEVLDAGRLKVDKNSKKYLDVIDKRFDTIIVDPPRKGLDKVTVDYINYTSPKKLLYVSCDPSTLSRDLNLLCNDKDSKYNIECIKCVDMFPNTMHVETIVLLSRIKN